MKTYYVHFHDHGTPKPIQGETIFEAVENNFEDIGHRADIGNAAGFQLEKVVLEYRPEILGGKGGAALTITARGSDMLVRYDPRNDTAKTVTLMIEGVTPEELPEPDITTFDDEKEEAQYNPYADPENLSMTWGNVTALLNEVGENRCRVESVWPSVEVSGQYHNLDVNNPFLYLELMRQKVSRAHPKTDAQTKKMLDQIDKLALQITEHTKEENAEAIKDFKTMIYTAKAAVSLRAENKITALAYYRNKAGLSGRELAEKVGISDRQIRNYESPRNSTLWNASTAVVQAIADVLGVPATKLVNGGETVRVYRDGKDVE